MQYTIFALIYGTLSSTNIYSGLVRHKNLFCKAYCCYFESSLSPLLTTHKTCVLDPNYGRPDPNGWGENADLDPALGKMYNLKNKKKN